ncbi:nuclear envelope integral membrane protein-like [Dermacentor variabilis]|uniref:nuclear envelope integral membrane protein-like n=1 Tax=Dermacentor variabilis TaxID=34621 RepID=UPI003F5B36AF
MGRQRDMTGAGFALSAVIVLLSALGRVVGSAVLLEEHRVYSSPQKYDYVGGIDVYCWEPPHDAPSYLDVFRTTAVEFSVAPDDLQLFTGEDEQTVQQKYFHSGVDFSFWATKLQRKVSFLNSRHRRCLGVFSRGAYEFEFVRSVNHRGIAQFCFGIVAFFVAPVVSRSAAVFYTCGTSIGVFAFLLVAVFLVSRLLPRRAAGYALVLFGWSLVVSWLEFLWSNVQDVVDNYRHFVVCYVVGSAAMSFAVCYRVGPPSNPRTLNLIQWSLQLIGLACVYFSSDRSDVMAGVVIVMVSTYLVLSLSRRPPASNANGSTPTVLLTPAVEEGATPTDSPRASSCTHFGDDGMWTIVTKIRAPQAKKIAMCIRADDGIRSPRQWVTLSERDMLDNSGDEFDHFLEEANVDEPENTD